MIPAFGCPIWYNVCLRRQRIGAFAQQAQEDAVDEDAAALPAGRLVDDAQLAQVLDAAGDGWLGQTELTQSLRDRCQCAALQQLMQPQRGGGGPAELLDAAAVVAEQAQQALGGLRALPGGLADAAQEEVEPGCPGGSDAPALEVFVKGCFYKALAC